MARQTGSSLESSASLALEESGSVVLINSMVLTAGFSVLVFSHFAPLTAIGLLTAGVLLASALVSLLLPVMVGRLKVQSAR